ncbi:MAG: hypothetical protein ABW321_18090 [Polyangiales bacterium]
MVEVSNADRVVFPEVGKTKGDVVRFYERIAARALPHLTRRPLSIKRYPKGLAAAGFFQKNVPPHYPASIERFGRPRSHDATRKHGKDRKDDVTLYPLVSRAEHLAYLANQGALELHVPTARAPAIDLPDRFVIDLDPPPGERALVRRAAELLRAALDEFGLPCVPIATGSKGYHLTGALAQGAEPAEQVSAEQLGLASFQLATLVAARHPDVLTVAYRIALRHGRVFVDWLRNTPNASGVAPFSLRASPRATVAAPITWSELATTDSDAFHIDDVERLLERPDPLAELAEKPVPTRAFAERIATAFEASGLVLETFDRFRS